MTDNKYTKNSINSLPPREFTRKNPGVYAGDCTYSTQLLVEALSNAVDEYRIGHGKEIKITIKDDVVSVQDHGQGILVNQIREKDGETTFQAICDVMNTSGKFNEEGVYEGSSLGRFGIGLKIITFLSDWMVAETTNDGKTETLRFEDGILVDRKITTAKGSGTGATFTWKPSKQFFDNTIVELARVRTDVKTTACLCKGLTIDLIVNGKAEKYYSQNGLRDLIDDAVKGKEIVKNRLLIDYKDSKNKLDFAMACTSKSSPTIIPYINTGLTESGPHISQIKSAITRTFNKFFKEKGWLKEKDSSLSGDEVQEGLYIVFNITTGDVMYDAQVKSRVTKVDMKPFIKILNQSLEDWLEINEADVKKIFDKAILAKKVKEATKKAKDKVLAPKAEKKKSLKEKLAISEKFIDCQNKKAEDRELLLVEGTK